MIAKILIFAILVATISLESAAQNTTSISYEDAIPKFLLALKKHISCRYKEPWVRPQYDDFVYKAKDTNIEFKVRNFRTFGGTNFYILDSTYDPITKRAAFDVIVPKIQSYGKLNANVNITIGDFPLHWKESIMLNIKVTDLRILFEYGIVRESDKKRWHYDFKFFIGDVKADNWLKHLDIAANNHLNDIFGSLSLLIAKEIQPYLNLLIAFPTMIFFAPIVGHDEHQAINRLLKIAKYWDEDCPS